MSMEYINNNLKTQNMALCQAGLSVQADEQ